MRDEPDRDARPPDPSRRVFFRHLGRNAVQAAGNVAGTADFIRRGSAAAAAGLLGLTGLDGRSDPAAPAPAGSMTPAPAAHESDTPSAPPASAAAGVRSSFRNPYRVAGGHEVVILDQRQLPTVTDIVCRDAREVARAIRERAIEGAPVAGQVAAYAMAMTAHAARDLPAPTRDAIVRQAARELLAARPSARPLEDAVERMLTHWTAGTDRGRASPAEDGAAIDGATAAEAMRLEADAIATDAMLDHAALARSAAAALPMPVDRPIGLLVHGSAGALAGGQVGTALGIVSLLAGEGHQVHLWVTESRPGLEGARIAAWELEHLGVPFTVVPDTAAGWLLTNEPVDAVLVGAERIARNGDVANTLGTFSLAATARAVGVPLWVCAPSATIDLAAASSSWRWAQPGVGSGSAEPEPLYDVTPAALVDALFTEHGRAEPVTEERVVAASEARARRRLPPGHEVGSATRHLPEPRDPVD